MADDELLTVDEVAERVKVNPETVRRWIKSGRLPAARPAGGPYRIHLTDLDRLFGVSPKDEAPPSPQPVEEGEGRRTAEAFSDAERGTPSMTIEDLGRYRRGVERQNGKLREDIEAYEKLFAESAPDHEEAVPLSELKEWIDWIDTFVDGQRELLGSTLDYEGLTGLEYTGLGGFKDDWEAEQSKLKGALGTLLNLQEQAQRLVSRRQAAVRYADTTAPRTVEEGLEDLRAQREQERK